MIIINKQTNNIPVGHVQFGNRRAGEEDLQVAQEEPFVQVIHALVQV